MNDIWNYITNDLENPTAATNVVNTITATLDRLVEFPEMGAPLSSIANVENDYRFLISSSYMSFYRTAIPNIYVDRVLYARRDYMRILFDGVSETVIEG